MLGKDRIITAVWMLPLVAAAVIFPPAWGFALLFGLLAAVGQWELYRFHFKDGLPVFAWVGCLAGLAVVMGTLISAAYLPLAAGAMLVLVLRMTANRPMETALAEAAVIILGMVYVAGLLAHIPLLRGLEGGVRWIFFLMLVTWANDAAAYYVGSKLGKNKLTAVSPNKTVEGTLGGFGFAVVAAYIGSTFVPDLDLVDPLLIGLNIGLLALLGDLVESLFKRGAGVKDSSTLIPAHGGVMDKLDAFLFTAPGLYYYLTLVVW